MENFYVYYKDEPTLKHYSYYPLTKESKVLKRPDLQAHRYHIFDSYFTYQRKEETIEEYVKKPLERFGEDLMKWNEQLRNDKELLRRLHVKENDKIIQGAEAFLYVWKKIPKYKFLYKFFKLPVIFTIFKYGYEIIAFFLYLKNKKQLKN